MALVLKNPASEQPDVLVIFILFTFLFLGFRTVASVIVVKMVQALNRLEDAARRLDEEDS